MSGPNLGFRIEDDESVRFDDGSWRYATAEEVAMWPLVAIAEIASETYHADDHGHGHFWEEGEPYADCGRCASLEAAFRAAKEKQR